MQGIVDDVHAVSEDQIKHAMRMLYDTSGLIVEPAGAVGLAGIMAQKDRFAGRSVALVITGAYLTPAHLQEWILQGH